MGSTFKTTNLGLPQFCEHDIPQWLGDMNPAFKAIDDHAGEANANIEQATQLGQQGIDDAAAAQATADTANQRSLENKTNIATLTTKTGELDTRLTTAEQNIATNTGNITTNAQNIAENAAKIAAQEQKITEQDGRLATLEAASGDHTTQIEQIKTKDAQQDAEIEQTKQQLTVLQSNALTTNPADRIMKNGVDVTRIVFPSESVIEGDMLAIKGLEAPEDDNDAVRKKYVDDLHTEVTSSVTELSGKLDTANENIANLTTQLEEANQEIATLKGQLETANQTITTLQVSLSDISDRVVALEGKAASELSVDDNGVLMKNNTPVSVLKVTDALYAGDISFTGGSDELTIEGSV